MRTISIQLQLLVVLLLGTAAAFRAPSATNTCPARIRTGRVQPLYAVEPNAATDVAAGLVITPMTTWKELVDAGADPKDAQQAFSMLTETLASLLLQTIDKMQTLLNQINEAFVTLLASLAGSGDAAAEPVIKLNLEPILAQIKVTAAAIGVSNDDMERIIGLVNEVTGALNTPEAIAATAVVSYVVVSSILTWGDSPPPGRPYPKGKYDPVGARVFFGRRPLQVLARSLTIASKSLTFALSLAGDKLKGDDTWNSNQEQRGLELAQLLTELGPTFIKSKLRRKWELI